MKKSINLIRIESDENRRLNSFKKKLDIVSVGIAVVFVIIAGGVFFFLLNEQKQLDNLNKTADSDTKQIQNFSKRESFVLTITDRSEKTNAILQNRPLSYAEVIAKLKTLFIPEFQIADFSFTNRKLIKLSGNLGDVISLAKFQHQLESLTSNGTFTEIKPLNVQRDQNGIYIINLELNI